MPTAGHVSSFTISAKDISPYLTSVTVERDNDTLDTSTFGTSGHTFTNGLTNGKITLNGLWDKTASVGSYTALKALVGAGSAAFIWGPEGTTSGNVKITGNAVLESYTESSPVADLITFTASLQITGTVTDGVYP